MLKGRFMSCLHAMNDAEIGQEIAWAEAHLPETLDFADTLECLIFTNK